MKYTIMQNVCEQGRFYILVFQKGGKRLYCSIEYIFTTVYSRQSNDYEMSIHNILADLNVNIYVHESREQYVLMCILNHIINYS